MAAKGEKKQPEEKKGSKLSLQDKENIFLLIVFIAFAIWSLYDCGSYFIWFLEAAIPIGVVLLLIATYKRFPLTRLAYYLILLHSFILLYGAHYGYAHAPLGVLMKDLFGFQNNHYDKIGHIAFGFFPAVIIKEIIVRTTTLKRGKMLFFLVVSVVGVAAAFYEIIEWIVSVLTNDPAFANTQGDPWDAQKDMALALAGVIVGLVIFTFFHTKQMLKRGFISKRDLGRVKEKTPEEIEQEKAEKKEFDDFRTKWKDKKD
jgi:putative membrane protein